MTSKRPPSLKLTHLSSSSGSERKSKTSPVPEDAIVSRQGLPKLPELPPSDQSRTNSRSGSSREHSARSLTPSRESGSHRGNPPQGDSASDRRESSPRSRHSSRGSTRRHSSSAGGVTSRAPECRRSSNGEKPRPPSDELATDKSRSAPLITLVGTTSKQEILREVQRVVDHSKQWSEGGQYVIYRDGLLAKNSLSFTNVAHCFLCDTACDYAALTPSVEVTGNKFRVNGMQPVYRQLFQCAACVALPDRDVYRLSSTTLLTYFA